MAAFLSWGGGSTTDCTIRDEHEQSHCLKYGLKADVPFLYLDPFLRA